MGDKEVKRGTEDRAAALREHINAALLKVRHRGGWSRAGRDVGRQEERRERSERRAGGQR